MQFGFQIIAVAARSAMDFAPQGRLSVELSSEERYSTDKQFN